MINNYNNADELKKEIAKLTGEISKFQNEIGWRKQYINLYKRELRKLEKNSLKSA